jgi:O-antigen ligase
LRCAIARAARKGERPAAGRRFLDPVDHHREGWRVKDAVRGAIFASFLVACLILGGASREGAEVNLALQVAGIGFLGWGLFSLDWRRLALPSRLLLGLVTLGVVVVLAQFIVLPVETWRALPGRQSIAAELALLGVVPDPAMVTLSFHESLRSATALLPAIGMGLALLAVRKIPAAALSAALVATALLALVIGILQVMGGREAAWYFYGFTNRGYMVGFFANANHMATLLLVSLPFIAALVREARTRFPAQRTELTIFGIALFALVVIGIGLVGSLTGYALVAPVGLASALIVYPVRQKLAWLLALPLLAVSAAALVLIGDTENVFGSEGEQSMAGRSVMSANTLKAAQDFLPVGSGLGTFEDVYRRYEDQEAVTRVFINHAHNDYLELLLELGAAGVVLVVLFLAWWAFCFAQLLRGQASPYAWAGWIATGVILTHSGWDYPLRTAALSTVFAIGCVFLGRLSISDASPERGRTSEEGGDARGWSRKITRR